MRACPGKNLKVTFNHIISTKCKVFYMRHLLSSILYITSRQETPYFHLTHRQKAVGKLNLLWSGIKVRSSCGKISLVLIFYGTVDVLSEFVLHI